MKNSKKSLILLPLLLAVLISTYARIRAEGGELVLSDNDITLIEKALESTAPDCEFSASVALASVILNRYRSSIYPDSVLSIIEGADFLEIDHTITPSERSRLALTYALHGSSPIKDAIGAFTVTEDEEVSVAEYIIIGNWCFYAE